MTTNEELSEVIRDEDRWKLGSIADMHDAAIAEDRIRTGVMTEIKVIAAKLENLAQTAEEEINADDGARDRQLILEGLISNLAHLAREIRS